MEVISVGVSDLKSQIVKIFDDQIESLEEEINGYDKRKISLQARVPKKFRFGIYRQVLEYWRILNLNTLEESKAASQRQKADFLAQKNLLQETDNLGNCLSLLEAVKISRISKARETSQYSAGKQWGEDADPVNEIEDLKTAIEIVIRSTPKIIASFI